MKKMTLLISVISLFSCNSSPSIKTPKLSGKYVVGGFKVTGNLETAGGQLVSATEGTNYAFNFINDDSIQISSKLGIAYFSDSTFKYKLTDKTLHLSGKNGEHFIPYRQDGDILNLFVHKNGIDTLQIMPSLK